MTPWPSMFSDTTESAESFHKSLENALSTIDDSQLESTITTLEPTAGLNGDVEEIRSSMSTIEYQTLEQCAEMLDEAYNSVSNPHIRSKNKLLDDIETGKQNLTLIYEPMFDRRYPEEALSIEQATRFALKNYTQKELVRQHAAVKGAYSALTRIRDYKSSSIEQPDSYDNPTNRSDLEQAKNTVLQKITTLFETMTTSTKETDSPTPSSNVSEKPSHQTPDFDPNDITWGDVSEDSTTDSSK